MSAAIRRVGGSYDIPVDLLISQFDFHYTSAVKSTWYLGSYKRERTQTHTQAKNRNLERCPQNENIESSVRWETIERVDLLSHQ